MMNIELDGYSEEDLSSPYFKRSAAYRSVPGYPHIWILVDGTEVWNARRKRPLKISLNQSGYPIVKFGGRSWRVQRLVLAAWFPGCLDDGLLALHKIPDRTYCAVWNLYPGTQAQNVRDKMVDAGNIDADHCNRGHPLTHGNLVRAYQKKGARACLACARARARVSDTKRRKGVDLSGDLQAIADSYFAQITADCLAQSIAVTSFTVTCTAPAVRQAVLS